MGAYCAKLCDGALPNIRRQRAPPQVRMVRTTSEVPSDRFEALRDSSATVIFKEGFALGLQVRKLQKLLESLDASDGACKRRPRQAPLQEQEDRFELSSNKAEASVSEDRTVSVEIHDEVLQVVGQARPHDLCTLNDLLEKDSKQWLRVAHG